MGSAAGIAEHAKSRAMRRRVDLERGAGGASFYPRLPGPDGSATYAVGVASAPVPSMAKVTATCA